MGRAPCCEKMGLKKGPWTPEEDQILINYISLYGHGNWRALPKQAGLLRCGKSCRLRWINYLRPDIKRGNFTREEEDTIIKLHAMLGNRWSAIAARLPGRTDNEIKNVWHTHLKKRLAPNNNSNNNREHGDRLPKPDQIDEETKQENQESPQHSGSTTHTSTLSDNNNKDGGNHKIDWFGSGEDFQFTADESFWSQVLSTDRLGYSSLDSFRVFDSHRQVSDVDVNAASDVGDRDMAFWYNMLTRAGGETVDMPDFC